MAAAGEVVVGLAHGLLVLVAGARVAQHPDARRPGRAAGGRGDEEVVGVVARLHARGGAHGVEVPGAGAQAGQAHLVLGGDAGVVGRLGEVALGGAVPDAAVAGRARAPADRDGRGRSVLQVGQAAELGRGGRGRQQGDRGQQQRQSHRRAGRDHRGPPVESRRAAAAAARGWRVASAARVARTAAPAELAGGPCALAPCGPRGRARRRGGRATRPCGWWRRPAGRCAPRARSWRPSASSRSMARLSSETMGPSRAIPSSSPATARGRCGLPRPTRISARAR